MMKLLEEFVVLMYSAVPTNITTVNCARYELFHYAGKEFDALSPTQDALKLHARRAAFTGGHIWGQALRKAPPLPSPTQWGYEMKSEILQPTWISLPTLSKKYLKICHCKKECKPPCVCATNISLLHNSLYMSWGVLWTCQDLKCCKTSPGINRQYYSQITYLILFIIIQFITFYLLHLCK